MKKLKLLRENGQEWKSWLQGHLRRFGIIWNGTEIYISRAHQPLGGGLWGIMDFLHKVEGARVVDFHSYDTNMKKLGYFTY